MPGSNIQHTFNPWGPVPLLTALLAIACADGRGPSGESADTGSAIASQAEERMQDVAGEDGDPNARESSEQGRQDREASASSATPPAPQPEAGIPDPEPNAQEQAADAPDAGLEQGPKSEPVPESDPTAYAYRACGLPTGLNRAALIARRDDPAECIRVVLVELGSVVPAPSDEPVVSGIDMPGEWAIESALRSTQLEGCTALAQLPTALEARTGVGSISVREQSGTFRIEGDLALDFIDGAETHRVRLRFDDLAARPGPENCE